MTSSGPGTLEDAIGPGCRSGLVIPILIVLALIAAGGAATIGPDLLRGLSNPPPNRPGNQAADRPVPPVSNRFFSSGTSTAMVSGALTLTDTIEIDPIASYAQDGLVWISFVDPASPGSNEILVVFNEPEDSVTVAQGTTVAIGQDDACAFDVEVTDGLLTGHVSCASVQVQRDGETAGTATIELEFSAVTDPDDAPGD